MFGLALAAVLVGFLSWRLAREESGAVSPSAPSTSPATNGPSSTSRAPKPLAVPAYRWLVSSVSRRIDAAFVQVAQAKTYSALTARLRTAETVLARERERLAKVTPPKAVSGAHGALVGSLKHYAYAVGKARQAVAARSLCGAPSVVARLGGSREAAAVRAASGRIQAAGYKVGSLAPKRGPLPDHRLPTGRISSAFAGWGRGTLDIDNGLGLDAVVRLTQGGKTVAAAFVGGRDTYKIGAIPDGTYSVFFTAGRDWNEQLGLFTRSCRFDRFDDPLDFETTTTATSVRWTTFRITLHPVVGGTASTTSIAPSAFPR